MPTGSDAADTLSPGWGWYPGKTAEADMTGSVASPNAVTATCARC